MVYVMLMDITTIVRDRYVSDDCRDLQQLQEVETFFKDMHKGIGEDCEGQFEKRRMQRHRLR
jgi:hypothetical protein